MEFLAGCLVGFIGGFCFPFGLLARYLQKRARKKNIAAFFQEK